jgi:hypothetical protein
MLSPHELATLMLARYAPDQIDLSCAEFCVLLERELVMLERSFEGCRRAMLTEQGHLILNLLSAKQSLRAADIDG